VLFLKKRKRVVPRGILLSKFFASLSRRLKEAFCYIGGIMGTKTEMMSGAQIIIETLIEQGVTDVFGYPGGQVLNIYDELYKASDRINHVLAAHEQGASHAADGYSRVTGKVGVVIATSGPGATNLVTGIATAMLDSIPMVAITGNVPTSLIGKDSFQEINIMGITLPITKASAA